MVLVYLQGCATITPDLFQSIFIAPKEIPYPLSSVPPHSSFPSSPGKHNLLFVSLDLSSLNVSYQCNRSTLVWLLSFRVMFPEITHFGNRPTLHSFLLLNDIKLCIYLLISLWTFRLFPLCG